MITIAKLYRFISSGQKYASGCTKVPAECVKLSSLRVF